ncbi:30S ribosomal protein S6 [Emcibacter nanhaiensis]|uniref:Small ribosomal subunit protein bS6 n=1 Tax=Emcibacter nanhaiensis TaxID=1505037 RepID=A0A501PS20_9PROT|nr:30S ribosomal protein S6 [Emcibacter nanhaiensis]TPD62948.1 30S ribosomal protein S6 [Emcibacter nanhaiensis]
MPCYEYTYIARQDIQPQQVEAITNDLTAIIENNGGKVTKSEYWGLRNLAYRIKKYKKGHYVHLNVDAGADAIAELERNSRLHEDVVRYMTIRVEEFEDGESVVLRSKEREGRGGRYDRDDNKRSDS